MKKLLMIACAVLFAGTAQAAVKPAFSGQNYSGAYQCKGVNGQIGDYEVSVVLRLNRVSSYAKFGAYYYEVKTVNNVSYSGQAVADGNRMAISFQLTDRKNIEHSTGIATMKKLSKNRWSFRKLYYEPDDSGGIYGYEDCIMQTAAPAAAEKAVSKKPA